MHSTITSKFQTTIPKVIRENLAPAVNETLESEIHLPGQANPGFVPVSATSYPSMPV